MDNTLDANIFKNVVSGAAGAALGGASGAASGANGAFGADLYNRQLHTDKDPKKDERKTLDALEKGKSADEKQKYEDAACYMVHCADQMSDGNPAKQAALDSENRGAHDTKQQGELASTGLFKYDPLSGPELDSIDRYSDESAVRGFKNLVNGGAADLVNQFLTLLRRVAGAHGPADDLTSASNNGGPGGPTATAVVTPTVPVMTPEGPVPAPSVAIPGSPGYVPPTATVSSNGDAGKASGNTDGANAEMLGARGPQFASKRIWKGDGSERIDVENPNPGQRPGQIHYQDNDGNKYLYDPNTNSFPGAPNSVNKLLKDPSFSAAIQKRLTKYLGGH